MIAIKNTMDKILKMICAFLFLFLVFLNFYQVFMRYVLNSPSTVSEELLGYAVVWLSLLGAALVFGQDGHIKVPIFYDRLVGMKRIIALITIEFIIMIIAISVLIIGGKQLMDVGAIQVSPTLNITLNWVYAILPISGVLTVIYNILTIMTTIQNYKNRDGVEIK